LDNNHLEAMAIQYNGRFIKDLVHKAPKLIDFCNWLSSSKGR